MKKIAQGIYDITFKYQPKSETLAWQHKWKTVFTSEQGTVLSIPGFYAGKNCWITRFSPTEAGKWTYESFSTYEGLNSQKGELTYKEEEISTQTLIIDPTDPTKLTWSDGKPYFLLGFECDWLALLDHDEEKTPRADLIIDAIDTHGFNHVVMNVYARDTEWPWVQGRGSKNDYADPPLWPFGGSCDYPDYSKLNPAFFLNLDMVVEELHKRNIVCHLMIYVWNKKVPWPKLSSPEDNAFYDYVVARYQAFSNILWDVSKEAVLYGDCTDEFITERCKRTRKADAYHRLLTVHDRGYCERHPQEVDIMSTQTWSTDLFNNMKDLASKFPYKPVFNIEHGGYEKCQYNVFPGDYINADVCLDRNYQCLFAGVYSTYYWQGCSWNIVIPEINDLSDDDRPKLEYFSHMTKFFARFSYNEFLLPLKNMGSSGYWLIHKEEKRLLLYKPQGQYGCHMGNGPDTPFNGEVPKKLNWFNTLTGEFKETPFSPAFSNEGHDKNMGQWFEFTSPWGNGPSICVIEW